jgi:hypothetical protein
MTARRRLALWGLLLPAALQAQYSRERVSLVLRGEEALQRQEIGAAIDAFREAARDTSAVRRAAAERMLGVISWRFYKDNGSARLHFGTALATERDTSATLVELARLSIAEGRYRLAYDFADRARRSATDDIAHRGAIIQMGRAVTEAALAARLDGANVGAADRPDGNAVAATIAALSTLVRETPGRGEESRLLLLTALIAGDGATAATAVHSYYLIGVGNTGALERVLRVWPGGPGITGTLTRAKFIDAAALVAPPGAEILAYAAYCRRIAREADEYYRRTLLGEARSDELTRLYIRASHDLWPRLTWPGAPPRFYPAAVEGELARRFGTLVELGVTGGYYDMHMGHVVDKEERTVAQYGHRARVTLFVIDGIVTNGLQSWAWDDAGGHGGWQRGDTIVQVRPIFVEHAISLWVSGDPARQAREQRSIASDSAYDWKAVARDSIKYLPGVAGRLRRDGRDALLDSLRRAGAPDSLLGAEFVRAASQVIQESSIIAHEGRHAIDDALAPALSTEEREYRAKLSEIAFAERPKIVMSSIVHPNIGDATPHGRANARVMLGLLRWMRAHSREIRGLDVSRPLMPQLPLLTDQQLRMAFRSMDPLAMFRAP